MTKQQGPAATRWRRLLTARLDEMERLEPGAGDVGPKFWDTRATAYTAAVAGTAEHDPFLEQVRADLTPESVVADIGAGSGRLALTLAADVAEVIAVDQSPAMLDLLQTAAAEQAIDNITVRTGRWPDVDGVIADVAICSYVVPIVVDIGPFLLGLDGAARHAAHFCMNAASLDLGDDHLWRYFHGDRRAPAPTYLDAAAAVAELGLDPTVTIVLRPASSPFASLDDAVERYRRRLLLADDAHTRDELAGLLTDWLVADDGGLHTPFGATPMAIISWRPDRA